MTLSRRRKNDDEWSIEAWNDCVYFEVLLSKAVELITYQRTSKTPSDTKKLRDHYRVPKSSLPRGDEVILPPQARDPLW